MICFEDLDDDVLQLILDYVSTSLTLMIGCQFLVVVSGAFDSPLRSTSSRLKGLADSVNRKRFVRSDNDTSEQVTYRFVKRLLGAPDRLSYYVRDLQITAFRGDDNSYGLNTYFLTESVCNLYKLDSLRFVIHILCDSCAVFES
jgi:hypothetical protein